MAKGTRYPAQFRAEVIRLYKTSTKPHREVAEELRIAPESLQPWVIQADVDAGDRAGLSSEERDELRLRKENRALREEREILKKAAAFFAKEENRIAARAQRLRVPCSP